MRLLLLAPGMMPAFDQRVLAPILGDAGIQIVGAVIDARPAKTLRRRLSEELRRGRGGYVLVMAINKLLERDGAGARSTEDYCRELSVPFMRTEKLYDPATVEWVRAQAPDALYRIGFGIIKEPILSIAPMGVLSYHHGDIRRYRGQPVAFWEVYNNESEMGVTVQRLDAGLDCGRIVAEEKVPIHRGDGWKTVNDRAYEASIPLLHRACRLLQRADFRPESVAREGLGRIYTSPNLRQWTWLQLKVLFRKLTRILKH